MITTLKAGNRKQAHLGIRAIDQALKKFDRISDQIATTKETLLESRKALKEVTTRPYHFKGKKAKSRRKARPARTVKSPPLVPATAAAEAHAA